MGTRIIVFAAALTASATAAGAVSKPVVVARIGTGGDKPCASVGAFGSVYVANHGSGTIARIDPKTNRLIATRKVANGPCGIVAARGSLWVEDYTGDQIVQVNPRTLRVVKRIHVGSRPWDVGWAFGSIWSSNLKAGT